MATQNQAPPQKTNSTRLFQRVVAAFRRRYELREGDHIDRKIRRSLHIRGLLGTVKFCTFVLFSPARRRKVVHASGKSPSNFDLRFGVETSGWLEVADLDIEEHLRINTVGYQATPPELVREAIDFLNLCHSDFAFLDIGCGKGLALLVASEYPFRKIIGLELSPTLSRIAQQNAAKLLAQRNSSANIQVILGDALEYPLPEGPLVVFLYNPFTGDPMKRLVSRLAAEHEVQSRDIYVIYVAAVEKRFFRSFSLLKDGFAMIRSDSPSCFDYCIYKV